MTATVPAGGGLPASASAPAPGARQLLVHEVLARAFFDEGVRDVYCLMGDGNKHWLVDMAALPGVRLVHARHEGAALAMADGHARARAGTTGEVGVCAVTYGPGVTQLSTSLMVAAKHGTPLVVFAADVPAAMRDSGGHLDVDERAVLEAAGAIVREVRDPAAAADDVHLAFHRARSEGAVVALLVAVDLQERPVPSGDRAAGARRPLPLPAAHAMAPDPRAVEQALAALEAAERPLVLVGRGAVLAGARAEVDEVVERLGAVVATTFAAKGWTDDHRRSLGIVGGFTLGGARAVLERADCVVAVGASLNEHTTDGGRLFGSATIVQIDVRPHALVRNRLPADVYLRADAAGALRCLCEGLRQAPPGPDPRDPSWGPPPEDPRHTEVTSVPIEVEPGRLDPRRLMLALDAALPHDALVVVGGGHFMAFAAQYLSNPGGRSFEMVFDFMTTGQAVPAGIGAAGARPDRPVVAVEGDASFLMHVQELETAARSGIGLAVLVMNDGALGAEYHKLRASGHDPTQALAEPPDLASLAVALGADGVRLDDLDRVGEVADRIGRHTVPIVVDCKVSRRVVGPL